MRYYDGPPPLSAAAVTNYLGCHLQDSKEVGALVSVPGYLSRDGLVTPFVNPNTWRLVGWNGAGNPPEELIRNLCEGRDRWGRKLTKTRSNFRPPKELLITMWPELAEALKDRPEDAIAVLEVAILAVRASIEEWATRRRNGKGRTAEQDWVSGKILDLPYIHGQNRLGEAFPHAHLYLFGPVFCSDGVWLTFENSNHLKNMSKPGGCRSLATEAMIKEAARRGFLVEVTRGTATGIGPQGAKVTCPDGRVIERGSVKRSRRGEVLAAQEMVRCCGANPLTKREVELVRRESGRFPLEIKGLKRAELLQQKLQALGLLDVVGRIHGTKAAIRAIQNMEAGMAEAQVVLEDLPHLRHADDAAQIVRHKRLDLCSQVLEISPDTTKARIRWTATYDRTLALVAENPDGLRTDDLDESTRNNLSKLKRAGILSGTKVQGRMVYRLTALGEERMQKGQDAQRAVEVVVGKMVGYAREQAKSPAQIRGRLESIGILVNPEAGCFELGSAGRSVTSPELLVQTGITPETPSAADRPWWERWWSRRNELPAILRRAIMTPEAWARRWWQEASAASLAIIQRQAAATRKEKEAQAAEDALAAKKAADRNSALAPDHRVSPGRTAPAPQSTLQEIIHGYNR